MTVPSTAWVLPIFLVLSWFATGLVHRYARRRGWLDHPIGRSSHSVPTPTSGGLGLVLLVSVGLSWSPSIVIGGLMIAAIGLIDDLRPLPVAPRLAVQAAGVVVALEGMAPLGVISAGPFDVDVGLLGLAAAWLAGIWFINLFNFMDGIDGIASAEATFVGVFAGILVWPAAPELATAWWIVGGAAGGLLVWGWPPARIFMGDVGSGFLGFVIVVLLLLSLRARALDLYAALILVAPFVCDTTITLLRRMARGEAWYAGHRLHGYQHLARRWGGHMPVTGAAIALNLVLVAPAAWWSANDPERAPWVAAAVFAIIIVLVVGAGAGRPETDGTAGE